MDGLVNSLLEHQGEVQQGFVYIMCNVSLFVSCFHMFALSDSYPFPPLHTRSLCLNYHPYIYLLHCACVSLSPCLLASWFLLFVFCFVKVNRLQSAKNHI